MAKEFPSKLAKKIAPEFMDSIGAMSEAEIKERILNCEQHIIDIEEAATKDEKLVAARESVKEWSAPYRESKAMENAKLRFCFYVLETRGISLSKE
jgi:hypothetical protein